MNEQLIINLVLEAESGSYGRIEFGKKLAELIVRECLKIVEPDRTSGDEWCVTLDETAQSIRQHFGLELKYD